MGRCKVEHCKVCSNAQVEWSCDKTFCVVTTSENLVQTSCEKSCVIRKSGAEELLEKRCVVRIRCRGVAGKIV